MKNNYTLAQQFIARLLLISVCLQSCGGGFGNNPLIPTREEQISPIQTNTQAILLPTNIQPLAGQVLTAEGGHAVTFYKEAGELQANVAMNVPQGFSKSYEGLDVCIEQGAELSSLPRLGEQAQQRRIRFQLAQGSQPAKVIIYKGAGLVGGSSTGNNKGKEKDTSVDLDNNEAEENDNDLVRYQQLLSLATEGEAEAQFILGQRAYQLWKKNVQNEDAYQEAIIWLEKSVTQNHEGAIALLKELRVPMVIEAEVSKNQGKRKIEEREIDKQEYEELKRRRVLEEENSLLQGRGDSKNQLRLGRMIFEEAKLLLERAASYKYPLAIDLLKRLAHLNYFGEEATNLGNFKVLPPELWLHILSYVGFSGILLARQANKHFYNLVTGYEQVGIVGVANKPQGHIRRHSWVINKLIDFNRLIHTSETIPSFPFYQLLGAVQSLPKEFWPYLKDTQIHTVSLNQIGDAAVAVIEFAKCLQGTNVQEINLNWTQIGEFRPGEFAQALQGTNVHIIHLRENLIDISGAVEFARNLQGTHVHTVDLSDNLILNQEALRFAQALQGTNVHTVVLKGTIGAEIQQLLQEQYPRIKWIF